MEINADHCEEQLKTTLHSDDKEKLRRKLALLQREYLKTAQRLQRAERSEAVRRHVKSRIEQENNKEQRQPELLSNPCVNPPSVALNSTDGITSNLPQCQENTEDSSGSETKRSQVIRFQLPSESDAASPNTPNPNQETARGHRSSPSLRLRSKRSRLRLERRSAAGAGRNSDVSEDGQEQSEKVATPEEKVKPKEAEVVNESEELFSGESGSLLLTHWKSSGQTEKMENQETQRVQVQMEKETKEEDKSISFPYKCQPPTLHTDEREKDGQKNEKNNEIKREEKRELRDGKLREDSNKCTKQNAAEKKERERRNSNTLEGAMFVEEPNVKAVGLLDSCTLVEGLLFPAEYYVRTTRRMSSSQSQPNMEAVIHTQLSIRRPRRSRGRGRGQNKHWEETDKSSQTSFSSPTVLSSPVGPCAESPAAGTPAELLSQSSCETSDQVVAAVALLTPNVTAARSARGRRRTRGRGRGRPHTPRCSLRLETNESNQQIPDNIDLTSSPAPVSPILHASKVPAPEPDPPEPATIHSTATQPCISGENGSLCSSDSGSHGRVYPMFVKSSSSSSTRATQRGRGTASWQSLLLSPSPAQTLLPFPSGPLVNHLLNLDYPQDFHLPDDQFASLKLHKLRRVSADSGVEHLTPPSSSTCGSIQHPGAPQSPVTPLLVPLSLTPVITDSSNQAEVGPVASQKKNLENLWIQQSDVQESSHQTHTSPAEPVLMVQDRAADFDQHKEKESGKSSSIHSADSPTGEVSEPQINQPLVISSEEQTHRPGVARNVDDQTYKCHQTNTDAKTENKDIIKTLSFDSPGGEPPEDPSRNLTKYNQSPVQTLNVNSPVQHSKKSPEHITSPPRTHRVNTQLLLSPLLASAPSTAPLLPPSFVETSPTLPFVGPTPGPDLSSQPLTSSPCAPVLNLPPPYSPSTQNLSPPPLSPCKSPTFFPPSQPQKSPVAQVVAPSELSQKVPPVPIIPSNQAQVGKRMEEAALRCIHTLKAPAGGCLVDACCLTLPSGGLCVAAAGKWAVCLWSQRAASEWSLTHTWAFNEPVINVFPIPDAADLLYVTLGQLEIREVRMLSCSSLSQGLLCEGLVQAVVGMSRSRVVTSSHSAPGSILQVFTLSDCVSTPTSQPLVSPGVCVGALAAVDGISDALIGTDEGGRLFVWNLKTGQLLRRISLTDGLSHTACLRGYSYSGVLFVLLQHHLLSSLEEEERESKEKDRVFSQDEKGRKSVLFSLVAVNPQSGKSVLATRLYPPEAWSGRLCEADVCSSRVVGLSQSGCACVWELERRGASMMMRATENEGWQLARWGGRDTLVTGHFNGDVSLHCYSTTRTTILN